MDSDIIALIDALWHMFSCYFLFKGISFGFRMIYKMIGGD